MAVSRSEVTMMTAGSARPVPREDASSPYHNRLLAALSSEVRERMFPCLQLVPMSVGMALYEAGDNLKHVYFPTSAIVSLLNVMEDGISTEITAVGNEGLIGVAVIMGGESTPTRAVVLSGGYAFRISRARLMEEFAQNLDTQKLLLRYTQALFTQIAQLAVCNRRHLVEQQLCRWLLLSLDRQNSNRLSMTQEFIANMLGVRRESITEIAGRLQKLEIIHYCRGQIEVLNRKKLEELCCECYFMVKKETDRLLPPQTSHIKPHWVTESTRPRKLEVVAARLN